MLSPSTVAASLVKSCDAAIPLQAFAPEPASGVHTAPLSVDM